MRLPSRPTARAKRWAEPSASSRPIISIGPIVVSWVHVEPRHAMARAVAVFLILLLLPLQASAQQRVALVMGNSAYQHTGALENPKNDAVDIGAVLKEHGFRV